MTPSSYSIRSAISVDRAVASSAATVRPGPAAPLSRFRRPGRSAPPPRSRPSRAASPPRREALSAGREGGDVVAFRVGEVDLVGDAEGVLQDVGAVGEALGHLQVALEVEPAVVLHPVGVVRGPSRARCRGGRRARRGPRTAGSARRWWRPRAAPGRRRAGRCAGSARPDPRSRAPAPPGSSGRGRARRTSAAASRASSQRSSIRCCATSPARQALVTISPSECFASTSRSMRGLK